MGTGFENPEEICASFPDGVRRFGGCVCGGGGGGGEAEGRGAAAAGSELTRFDDRGVDGVAVARAGALSCGASAILFVGIAAGTSTMSLAGQPTSLNFGRSSDASTGFCADTSRGGVGVTTGDATG